MWQRTIALVFKELLTLLKDKQSRFVITVPPLLQVLVFGFAATLDVNHVPIAIYNEDGSAASRQLIADFTGSKNFQEVAQLQNNAQIRETIDTQKALMVLHIGPSFSRDLYAGQPAPVQLIIDGRNSNTAMVALNYAREIVDQFNQNWNRQHGLRAPPAQLVTRAWFNPNLESRWFIVPGIVGLLTLVVTMVVISMTVAREREQGTFDQLLVTPLRPIEILLGKALPGMIIGLFEASLIILIAVYGFKVPLLGSLGTLYAGMALFILAAVGVGLMISSFAATMQQGLLGAFLFMVPAVILSGFATPIENMPTLVQFITYANPLRYFLVILRGVFLEGTPFHLLIDQFWPMSVIALITLALAGWLFRHRMY